MSTNQLEAKARSAEERLQFLEEKLKQQQGHGELVKLGENILINNKQLGELMNVRQKLVDAKETITNLESERDEVVKQLQSLEKQVSKLEYQKLHLKRAIAENDEKLAKTGQA
eukprot:TRINITY_DN12889_c0_g1_i1.p5 TRINITY_DN12889_c0_g1~~TRINITY_DN12889_c0_g1_i1.p5  ORF type:complete len:113 (-),score=17.65 TRINITY_DN12889_c0_g1_i1:1102-1440(-)